MPSECSVVVVYLLRSCVISPSEFGPLIEPSRAADDVNNPIDALHSTDLSLFLRDWTVLETFWIYFARDQNVADTSKGLFARILFQEELLLER